MRKTITLLSIAYGALASIAATAILIPSGAAAMSNANCWKRHDSCSKVCAGRSIGRDGCYRKCDVAVTHCLKSDSQPQAALPDTPKGRPIKPGVTIPGSRPGGGILDTTPNGIPSRGPASTGTRAPN
jgi:hypothetical protein